jgi:hypothetical protein
VPLGCDLLRTAAEARTQFRIRGSACNAVASASGAGATSDAQSASSTCRCDSMSVATMARPAARYEYTFIGVFAPASRGEHSTSACVSRRGSIASGRAPVKRTRGPRPSAVARAA